MCCVRISAIFEFFITYHWNLDCCFLLPILHVCEKKVMKYVVDTFFLWEGGVITCISWEKSMFFNFWSDSGYYALRRLCFPIPNILFQGMLIFAMNRTFNVVNKDSYVDAIPSPSRVEIIDLNTCPSIFMKRICFDYFFYEESFIENFWP